MSKKKNPAAQALAAKRWAGKTAADKQAASAAMHEAMKAPELAEVRKLRAKKAAAARWKGHKKKKTPPKKRTG